MGRILLFSVVVALSAACGGQHGQSICDNQVPPPAACMTMCNAQPGAPNTCPAGYHCSEDGFCDALCTPGGDQCGDGYHCTADGRCEDGSCTGLGCQVVDCAKQGKPSTTITGTVFAPNGTLPLYGINVYVPNTDPPPFTDGVGCDKCADELPGGAVSRALTDEAGKFTLTDVPAGANIPLVITSGKWRRKITISNVQSCADNPLPAAMSRLPKNKTEGDMPKIAITTGNADALECLVRKLGIDDAEITGGGGAGRVHLYSGNGANSFASGFPGGSGAIPSATNFWNTEANLDAYDIVILSCEGNQNPQTKPQGALDAMKAYADKGGRVFASHWHNIWIEGSTETQGMTQRPAVWPMVATWSNGGNLGNGTIDLIDEVSNPKGSSFATWMQNVMGSMVRGEIPIQDGTGRTTCTQVDTTRGERWTYVKGQGGTTQNFQFTTPNESPVADRCGKVVFSDMHVSGDSRSTAGTPFPTQCSSSPLTPQEKALAFMFFDIASCVGGLF